MKSSQKLLTIRKNYMLKEKVVSNLNTIDNNKPLTYDIKTITKFFKNVVEFLLG